MSYKKKLCLIVLIVSVFCLFLPSILSTKLGTKVLVFFLEQKYAKKIQVAEIYLSWLGQQKFAQVTIKDHNQPWFMSSLIEIDSSLISLLLLNKPKTLVITDPKLFWKQKSSASNVKVQQRLLYKLTAFESIQITKGSCKVDFLDRPSIQVDQIHLKWDTQKNIKNLLLQANSLQNQNKGSIALQSTFLLSKTTKPFLSFLTLITTGTNLPTDLLSFFSQSVPIKHLMGDVFNLKLNIQDRSIEQIYVFDLLSPLLNMQGKALWNKKDKKLFADSIPLAFTFTQDSYSYMQSLIKLPKVRLNKPSVFQGVISECVAYTKDTGLFPIFNISKLSFRTALTDEKLQIAYQEETSLISSLQIEFHISEDSISSQIQGKISAKKQGTFFANTFFKKQIQDIKIQCQAIPSYLLESSLEKFSLRKLCGPTIDAAIHINLVRKKGPISIEVFSPYSSLSLEGLLQENIVTLSKPFYCQMNPESASYLLNESLPFFSFLQFNNPISVKIAANEPLFFPYPFNPAKLTIPSVQIEIGKTLCQAQNICKTICNLLRIHQLDTILVFSLWVAPVNMHVHKGVVNLERVEILLANLCEVAIWGQIDIQNNLCNMQLGLPASTLRKVFKIPGLPSDYVLPIKLQGELKNPQIDLKKAADKIAELFLCQKEISNPLHIFFPSCKLLKETLIPPAKHPFPWEEEVSFTKDKKRKKFLQKEEPLKQLLKVLR